MSQAFVLEHWHDEGWLVGRLKRRYSTLQWLILYLNQVQRFLQTHSDKMGLMTLLGNGTEITFQPAPQPPMLGEPNL